MKKIKEYLLSIAVSEPSYWMIAAIIITLTVASNLMGIQPYTEIIDCILIVYFIIISAASIVKDFDEMKKIKGESNEK